MHKTPYRDFLRFNFDNINNVFFDAPWNDGLMTACNVNQAAEFITNSILFTFYTYVPLKQSFNCNLSCKTLWLNKEHRCLVEEGVYSPNGKKLSLMRLN